MGHGHVLISFFTNEVRLFIERVKRSLKKHHESRKITLVLRGNPETIQHMEAMRDKYGFKSISAMLKFSVEGFTKASELRQKGYTLCAMHDETREIIEVDILPKVSFRISSNAIPTITESIPLTITGMTGSERFRFGDGPGITIGGQEPLSFTGSSHIREGSFLSHDGFIAAKPSLSPLDRWHNANPFSSTMGQKNSPLNSPVRSTAALGRHPAPTAEGEKPAENPSKPESTE